jgi:uncharacterized protein YndB with AHSA1/START domain
MGLYIFIGVVAIIAVLLMAAAARPDDFKIERSATIEASPAVVFDQVNDLHKFQEWSPWAKMDPQALITYAGPASGTGASFAWAGNGKVGAGRMTCTESRSNELVRFRLDFEKPFKGTNMAQFTFQPKNGGTEASWSMTGKFNFVMKLVGIFMKCDDMIGKQFDQGLAGLKALAEGKSN